MLSKEQFAKNYLAGSLNFDGGYEQTKGPSRGNPNRPAVKKAHKKYDKAEARLSDSADTTKQMMAADYTLHQLKASPSGSGRFRTTSNQYMKNNKRANQSLVARGQKPYRLY